VAQLYDRAAGVVRAVYDRRIATPATLGAGHYFPNAKRFTDRWADIRREALAVAGTLGKVPRFHDVMPAQADISANDGRDWRVFIMKAYGVTLEKNLQRVPTVAALLDEAPEVMSAHIVVSRARQAYPRAPRPVPRHPALSPDAVDAVRRERCARLRDEYRRHTLPSW
jgi:aspartate beta-hydroxylase